MKMIKISRNEMDFRFFFKVDEMLYPVSQWPIYSICRGEEAHDISSHVLSKTESHSLIRIDSDETNRS